MNPTIRRASDPVEAPSGSVKKPQRTFPDPSLTLIEFGDGLSVLLAAATERDAEHKRVVLKKVAYIRLRPEGWGASACQEAWVGKDEQGVFTAAEAATGKLFRYPSRYRYEMAFISKDLFDTAIQCVKDRAPAALYELIAVTFAGREQFTLEQGALVGPDEYSAEKNLYPAEQLLAFPPEVRMAESRPETTGA